MGKEELATSLNLKFVNFKQGMVLFRQDDPPSSAYIVVSGKAGVFCNDNKELQVFASPRKGQEDNPDRVEYLRKKCKKDVHFKTRWHEVEAEREESVSTHGRRDTWEGFSTYHPKSRLGMQVACPGRGGMFGENSLLENGAP